MKDQDLKIKGIKYTKQEKVKLSVWKVQVPDGSGTGFFKGENHFITNFHVVGGIFKNLDIIQLRQGNMS